MTDWQFFFLYALIALFTLITAGVLIGWLLRRRKPANGSTSLPRKGKTGPLNPKAVEQIRRAESERLWDIFNQLGHLTETLNYNRVLNNALDLSARIFASDGAGGGDMVCAVLLFSEESDPPVLRVGAARRFTSADERLTFPGQEGLLRFAIDEGGPVHVRSVNQDPELKRVFALNSCSAAYCIPLRSGLDTYGVILFAHPKPTFFTAERRRILDFISNQAMIAIQNARLYQDLEQEKERMVEIEEEARKKLARDLHDGPTQSVAAIAMRLNFVRRLMERDPKAAADEIYKIEDLARRTTKEIRHMLFTLRPLVLESQGLIAAFDQMADKMRETFNQNVLIEVDPDVIPQLEMGKQGVIFNIAEEAVNNARKHAQAEHIWVRLKPIAEDLALLEIEDDGVGFDIESVTSSYDNRGSLGMINMRERAELVSGVFNIESKPGEGTRIQIVIPLTEEAVDRLHHR